MNIVRLAWNFLIEQRWPVLIALIYAPAMSLFVGRSDATDRESIVFVERQQAIFAVLFGMMFAASALNSDRRSRRILGVLSKAVHRYEYLLGIVVACWSVSLAYTGLSTAVLLATRPAGVHIGSTFAATALIALVVVCAATAGSTAVHPLAASAIAVVLCFGPAALVQANSQAIAWLAPAAALMLTVVKGAAISPALVAASIVHAIGWIAVGALIFQCIDIAVPVE